MPKLLQEKKIFFCFKIIATYINPALYAIFVITYVVNYALFWIYTTQTQTNKILISTSRTFLERFLDVKIFLNKN